MRIYLDNAATSMHKPPCVLKAAAASAESANPGRSAHRESLKAARILENSRESIAEFFKGDSNDFIFTLNCTDALNTAILGLLDKESHAVVTENEHNSVLRPLAAVECRFSVADSLFGASVQDIEKRLLPETKLVIVNHISNVTGAVSDIRGIYRLCRERNILFCVDAAQSAGCAPISCKDADIICCAGHKGLLGIMGSGILYLKKGLEIRPLRYGGTGTQSESPHQPDFRPDRYESGTVPLPAIASLGAGAAYIKPLIDEINQHECFLARRLTDGLRQLGAEVYSAGESGVVSFNMPGMDSGECASYLDDCGICVRPGLHCAPLIHKRLGTLERGAVRASFGLYNKKSDIDIMLTALSKL